MRSVSSRLATAAGVAMLAVACAKVPFTGRMQFNFIPDTIMQDMGATTYQDMLSQVNVVGRGQDVGVLTRVGNRISSAADQPKYDWQYSLIDDPTVNAWCLPGGYIGFYSGILPVLQSEAGMAFVMGHEVGHATARHGAERMSQQLTLLGGMTGLSLYLDSRSKVTPEQKQLILGALGVGATVGVMLPFSRAHESEADVIGMMYMAEAGYPPAESITVWDRMNALGGARPPAFLSTHPPLEKRQENQKEWLPQARKRYQRSSKQENATRSLW